MQLALALCLAFQGPNTQTIDGLTLPESARVLRVLEDERPDHFGMGILALGDVDGDGIGDMYVGARCGVPMLTQQRGYGDVFSGRTGKKLYQVQGDEDPEGDFFGPIAGAVGDSDGDGVIDFAVQGSRAGLFDYVTLFSGRSGQQLRRWEKQTLGAVAVDLDGDGRREILDDAKAKVDRMTARDSLALTGDLDGDGVRDFLSPVNAGSRGPFAAVRSGRDWKRLLEISAPAREHEIFLCASAGDADGDGFTDVVGAIYTRATPVNRWPAHEDRFRIVLCSGKDGRVLRDTIEELRSPGDLHVPQDLGDVDGDGCSDLFVAQYSTDGGKGARARILSGKSGSVVAEMSSTDWSFGASAANVGDLDGDGRPEIVIGEHEFHSCKGCAWVVSLGKR